MLADGHSLDTISGLSANQRVGLWRLYQAREIGSPLQSRLLHALYSLTLMLPRIMGVKNVRDIPLSEISPVSETLFPQPEGPEPEHPMDAVFKTYQSMAGKDSD